MTDHDVQPNVPYCCAPGRAAFLQTAPAGAQTADVTSPEE